jgi:hypothetical protein
MGSHFRATLVSVVLISILSAVSSGYIAIVYGANMSPSLGEFQQRLSYLFMTGSGAIIGLLGGRASGSDERSMVDGNATRRQRIATMIPAISRAIARDAGPPAPAA